MGDLEALFLVESGVLGDEGAAEGERRRRQRDHDSMSCALAPVGPKPNREPEAAAATGGRPFEHRILPIYGFVLI